MARRPARHARRPRAPSRGGAADLRDELCAAGSRALRRPRRPRRAGLRRGGGGGAGRVRRASPRPDLVRAAIEAEHRGVGERAPAAPAGARAARRRPRRAAFGSASSRTRSTRPTCSTPTSRRTASPSGSTRSCFSSEIGLRKPAPRIYQAVLERLGVEPADALFVGDRVREDVQGPAALGMRTCLVTYFRVDAGDHGLADSVRGQPGRGAGGRRQDHGRGGAG